MISTNHFKKGLKILVKESPHTILDFQHIKPGKGNQFTRTKLKNLRTGTQLDLTIRSGEKFSPVDITYKTMNFLYKEPNAFYFMDNTSYEQITLTSDQTGRAKDFLTEGFQVKICFFKEEAIDIELPKTVILKIAETDPGLKGNTAGSATKPATLETGLILQVPLHLNKEDHVKINTQDGSYIERVKKS